LKKVERSSTRICRAHFNQSEREYSTIALVLRGHIPTIYRNYLRFRYETV